jgi:hypothetical protein
MLVGGIGIVTAVTIKHSQGSVLFIRRRISTRKNV